MKFCSNCGKPVDEKALFCGNCGSDLSSSKTSEKRNISLVENRSIVLWIILSLITCGIANIVWFVYMVNDVNKICDDEKSNDSGATVLLLTLITCGIYGIIYFYQVGSRMERAGKKYNMQISDNSVLYLVLYLVGMGIVDYCLLQNDLNKFSIQ